nr:MAG TPA: hypothetical protein [Caudoviricetes sp.]
MAQPILPAQLEELKPLKQWVCYQAVWDDERSWTHGAADFTSAA